MIYEDCPFCWKIGIKICKKKMELTIVNIQSLILQIVKKKNVWMINMDLPDTVVTYELRKTITNLQVLRSFIDDSKIGSKIVKVERQLSILANELEEEHELI